jgi:hypothetical protein
MNKGEVVASVQLRSSMCFLLSSNSPKEEKDV